MFLPIEPPCDEWNEYTLPLMCRNRIIEICKDILKRADKTKFSEIYDAIYELVEADIETESLEAYE